MNAEKEENPGSSHPGALKMVAATGGAAPLILRARLLAVTVGQQAARNPIGDASGARDLPFAGGSAASPPWRR
jgi:hypothetical protein